MIAVRPSRSLGLQRHRRGARASRHRGCEGMLRQAPSSLCRIPARVVRAARQGCRVRRLRVVFRDALTRNSSRLICTAICRMSCLSSSAVHFVVGTWRSTSLPPLSEATPAALSRPVRFLRERCPVKGGFFPSMIEPVGGDGAGQPVLVHDRSPMRRRGFRHRCSISAELVSCPDLRVCGGQQGHRSHSRRDQQNRHDPPRL